jgi:hypothetical protein
MACLYGGQFIGDGTPAEVLANPRVREIYFGADPDLSADAAGGPADAGDSPADAPLEEPEKKDQEHE